MRDSATVVRSAPASLRERLAALPRAAWRSCPGCGTLVPADRPAGHGWSCPDCGHAFRLGATDRIASLADAGSFVERDAGLESADPLEFADRLAYPDRVAAARSATGLTEAILTGTARLAGLPVALAVMDFGFLGGSMGSVVGEKLTRAAEYALAERIPLIAVCSSGGARMQEGVFSLLQMAKTAAAVRRLADAGVPFLTVLADPVYGGVAASFAALGDVIVAEAGARAGFAGPKVIEQTIRSRLPAGFQSAEFLLEHGHVDLVVPRAELPAVLRRLLAFAAAGERGRLPGPDATAPGAGRRRDDDGGPPESGSDADAWEVVGASRRAGRPTVLDHLAGGADRFDRFLELHGDRAGGDDPAIVGGPAWLDGTAVMVVGHAKGTSTTERVRRNFGMPHPSGYRKAVRLYRLAERWNLPVVTLVDTPGAYPGTAAERANQSGAIAEALAVLSALRVPVVTVVTGEGGSGGALALAVGDRLLLQQNATLSVISPEGCATILYGDASQAPAVARSLRLRAADLYRQGIADEIVAEPPGGAHADPEAAVGLVAAAVRRQLAELTGLEPGKLTDARYERLRAYGRVRPGPEDGAPEGSSGDG
jgi:acetyl-CoA carboxylase carboxyl transferase subunit beta